MNGINPKPANFNEIEAKQLMWILIFITAALVAVNLINQLMGEPQRLVTRMIDLDTEANLPTWFSSALLAIAAFIAYRISVVAGPHHGRHLWQLVFVTFLLMSCDEVAMIHESVGVYFVNRLAFIRQLKISPWLVVLAVPLLAIFAVLAVKIGTYVKHRKTRIYLATGLLCLVSGAFVLEATLGFTSVPSIANIRWLWPLQKDFEEGLEMLGVILMTRGLLAHHEHLQSEETANAAKSKLLVRAAQS